jgi:hypothetical protein
MTEITLIESLNEITVQQWGRVFPLLADYPTNPSNQLERDIQILAALYDVPESEILETEDLGAFKQLRKSIRIFDQLFPTRRKNVIKANGNHYRPKYKLNHSLTTFAAITRRPPETANELIKGLPFYLSVLVEPIKKKGSTLAKIEEDMKEAKMADVFPLFDYYRQAIPLLLKEITKNIEKGTNNTQLAEAKQKLTKCINDLNKK